MKDVTAGVTRPSFDVVGEGQSAINLDHDVFQVGHFDSTVEVERLIRDYEHIVWLKGSKRRVQQRTVCLACSAA